MRVALLVSCSFTEYSSSCSWLPLLRMRDAISFMRVSVTVRAVMSEGAATTSTSELSMSDIAAPRPVAPPWNTSCSCVRRSARTVSPACTACAAAAWRVSSSLWLRMMVTTLTPLPM